MPIFICVESLYLLVVLNLSRFPVHTSITKSLSSESVSVTMVLLWLDYLGRMSGLFSLSESVSILNRFILMAALSTGDRERDRDRDREREREREREPHLPHSHSSLRA